MSASAPLVSPHAAQRLPPRRPGRGERFGWQTARAILIGVGLAVVGYLCLAVLAYVLLVMALSNLDLSPG